MKLRTYLERNSMTRRAFAKRVGCSPQAVGYYVTGDRRPSLPVALKIVKATGGKVTLKDLLDGKSEQTEEKDRAVA